jgi:Domain of unknown function (DUF6249)
MSIVEGLVPIILFFCITGGVLGALLLAYKVRVAQQETLRQVIQAGHQIDETTLKLLVKSPASPEMDLRSGCISILMGLGFIIGGATSYFGGLDQDFGVVLALIGSVILFTGLGQLLSWKLRSNLPNHSAE